MTVRAAGPAPVVEFLARRLSARRVPPRRTVAYAVAAAVVTGAAAGGAALAASSGDAGAPRSGGGPVATAVVVRTDLVNTVQEGGSLGYSGSFTVTAPAGASPSQVAQARQAVAQDEQALSADRQADSDAETSGEQAVSADRATVTDDESALSSDRARKAKACAGSGNSSPACSAARQKVSSDRAALTLARQQLAAAAAAAKTGDDQSAAVVAADEVRLRGDRAALASLRATETSPGMTFTWLPETGQVIREDQRVYSLSGAPVPLLYGPVPAYRAFYLGMPDGPDVAELTRDLRTLGYGTELPQSNHYSTATAAAAERWQKASGLPVTGTILLGEVVFEPGPIRVTSVTPAAGSAVSGGTGGTGGATVLTATGTTPVVTVSLGVTQEYLVKPGDKVSVTLPDGTTTVAGRVQSVGTVALCPGGGDTGTANGSSSGSAGQSPCSSSGGGGTGGSNSSPTVTVVITLDSTPPQARQDQAPVNVNVTSQRADNVLAVPVNALLALQGGGYGVDVVSRGASHLVGVTTGLYSDTMVQVSAPGLTAGMRVQVPSS
jgi:Putative peptidoglycan binding domain